MRLPAAIFEELEPVIDADGKVLRRCRIKGTTLIGTEVRMDRLIKCELVEVKPMEIPNSGIFFLDFTLPTPK